MKLVVAYVLSTPIIILVFGSMSLVLGAGTRSILNPGFHGLSEIMYAFASVTLNNGSPLPVSRPTHRGMTPCSGWPCWPGASSLSCLA